ncbi:TetR/AcrR family transcriptional regulator [Arthrobacter cryoconiti]|uniref:TetR/AcrR family transcriptional regulator n=1 Tax=Arthrobacter cryoconiti TaxID=748907 RepID=A0ABV8QV68_9MICC|nr:TetR family transcriptional regulator [Arthrobacter cryoconiti]MCC9069688.1 TetR family transcriptional regulator [Arthrobacter cryoconiti]
MSTEKERTADALSTSWGPDDLTSKARIRNAALSLFARDGQDGTSLRAIATEAHVTVGLVAHHYGTKEGLREAVDTLIVDLFADTLRSAPMSGTAREIVTLRDGAVAQMLAANPTIVDYLRRSLLTGQGQTGDVLSRLAVLTAEQVKALREMGLASTDRSVTEQTLTTLVRQFGRLLLQPLVNRIVDEFGEPGEHPPELVVSVKS